MVSMVKYPEIQKKCQEELDAVVGRSRMPTYADRDFLPYISAAVRECLRWKPIDPVGEQTASVQALPGSNGYVQDFPTGSLRYDLCSRYEIVLIYIGRMTGTKGTGFPKGQQVCSSIRLFA